MAKTLVTGGTGFIGSAVARQLVHRGDDVRVAARPGSDARGIRALQGDPFGPTLRGDVEVVDCDVLDRRAVRRAMKGVERVFHVAGTTSLRHADAPKLFEVHVGGTRTVLEEALRAGVERVVYTSSVAAIGPAARGDTADETQLFTAGHLGIAFVNSKHEAEAEAMRLAAKGLPVVCVNPCFVLGAGDRRGSSTQLVRRFMLGRIPLYVPGAINVVAVEDVARGHLLADARGRVGERYILGNRNYTWERLFADLSRLTGIDPPPVRLPAPVALRAVQAMEAAGVRPPAGAEEIKFAAQWWTYRSSKARRDLGWKPGPHEEAVEATVGWYLDEDGDRMARGRRGQPLALKLAGAGLLQLERSVRGLARLRPGLA